MTHPTNLLPVDGEVYFYPRLFTLKESDTLFEAIAKTVNWKQEPIVMMGRKVMQPRLTAWYGDGKKAYSYAGITMMPHPWTPELLMIKQRIVAVFNHPYSSALLNFYRDGRDSVGWHRDDEKELGINPVIGSVSFGAPRKFHLKHRTEKGLRERLTLTHGSFLLMKGTVQHNWYHSIPKDNKVHEGRINITFRHILE